MSTTGAGDVVVLSPHLDDAVLSLGGSIARWAGEGRSVQVCTAYTSGPPLAGLARRQRAFADYETRLAEDDEALALLGARSRRLGLRERIWREPRPRTLAGAFRTPSALDGFSELAGLVDVVRDLLSRPGVQVYAPLGVGGHVDHLEVTLATLIAGMDRDDLARIGFYEDFYALGEGFRRRHPVTRRLPQSPASAPGWAAPLAGLGLRLATLVPRGPGLADYLPAVQAASWSCTALDVAGFVEVKVDAVALYRSQTAQLGGLSRVAALTRRAARTRGGELVWRAVPLEAQPPHG